MSLQKQNPPIVRNQNSQNLGSITSKFASRPSCGIRYCLIPSEAPGSVAALVNKNTSSTNGNMAVRYATFKKTTVIIINSLQLNRAFTETTLPMDLTPFLILKKQKSQQSRRHRASSDLTLPSSSTPPDCPRSRRLRRHKISFCFLPGFIDF